MEKEWFNWSDDTHFNLYMSVWYPFLRKCQLSHNFWKDASIRSFSEKN